MERRITHIYRWAPFRSTCHRFCTRAPRGPAVSDPWDSRIVSSRPRWTSCPTLLCFAVHLASRMTRALSMEQRLRRNSWHTRLMATYSADRWSADSPGCSPRRSTANCVRHRRRHSSAHRCSCSADLCPRQASALFHLENELQYIYIYIYIKYIYPNKIYLSYFLAAHPI